MINVADHIQALQSWDKAFEEANQNHAHDLGYMATHIQTVISAFEAKRRELLLMMGEDKDYAEGRRAILAQCDTIVARWSAKLLRTRAAIIEKISG